MSQYMELREKWPAFIYEGYHIEETEEEFKQTCNELEQDLKCNKKLQKAG